MKTLELENLYNFPLPPVVTAMGLHSPLDGTHNFFLLFLVLNYLEE